MPQATGPVCFFDSGVGGLGVMAAARLLLPREPFVYLADQAHVPYGGRPLAVIRGWTEAAARHLRGIGAKLVVVACNTASAAALAALRAAHPGFPFVGMEPAVKPAAAATRSGRVGVLATSATFRGEAYARVVERFAAGVEIMTVACPELVEAVENGSTDSPDLASALRIRLAPLRGAGVDLLVLGCTHFSFAREAILQAAGDGVELLDPAPAVARRVRQVLVERGLVADEASRPGQTLYLTTGDPERLDAAVKRLLGQEIRSDRAALDG